MQWGALLLTRLDASQGTESQSHGQRKGGTQHQRAGGVRCGIRFCSHVPATARAGRTTFMSSRIGRVEAKKRSSTQQKMECGRGCFRALTMLALVGMVAVVVEADPAGAVYGSKPREPVEPWGDDSNRPPVPGWVSRSPDSGVPAEWFVAAMTSLAPHYRDDGEALEAHLREENAIFAALETRNSGGGGGAVTETNTEAAGDANADASATAGTRRAHLCCTNYRDGPALKKSLEADAGGKRFVRTALNSAAGGGYCAIAHVSSATAAAAAARAPASTADLNDVRCSPLTHTSKEPLSLFAPTSSGPLSRRGGGGNVAAAAAADADGAADGAPFFGLRLGPAVQSGSSRGLVVTLSPGSLPLDAAAVLEDATATRNTRGGSSGGGTSRDGGEARNRKLSSSSSSFEALEKTWRAFWGGARGSEGAGVFAETVPWTGSSAVSLSGAGDIGDGTRRRSLLAGDEDDTYWERRSGGGRDDRSTSRAREFHSGKAAGYKAALEHLSERMEEGREGGATLAETCGWDKNLVLVHGRDDLLYLRGIHHPEHSEATSEACFIGLVGFLSAQPEVMHIQPDARLEAGNKVLTAYIEGGAPEETPMRAAGLTGAGEVIGITDTGLDDHSCFFMDEDGQVPRTDMAAAEFYPNQRKVIQYVAFADDVDSSGHGTHVAGIAAGKVYGGWEEPWEESLPQEVCEDADLIRSCFGDCIEGTVGSSCHWNPELSCPMSDCDEDISCDEYTGYDFPCFGDPADEIPEASGVAPGAKLAFFDIGDADGMLIIPEDVGDMWDAQYAAGARVMSNSWSLAMQTEPSARDVQVDEWVHDHQDTLLVFGAGNNGFEDGGINAGSVQSPATAKTAMTVGASNSGQSRTYAYYSDASSNFDGVLWPGVDEEFQVSPFSARGPVNQFTAKPDVVAPGLMVHSAKASLSTSGEETCALDSLGGTSMAAPAVAGAAAIVRQYFSQGALASNLTGEGLCGGSGVNEDGSSDVGVYAEAGLCEAFAPSGYLVKAVLVNSAMWLGDMQTVSYGNTTQYMSVLDFAQGYGAVQLAASVSTYGAPVGVFYHDYELASEAVQYYSIFVTEPEKGLSVTVAWFDPPSMVPAYNLLHDLDVFVMSVDTRRYFCANHHDTMMAMCGDGNEACAQKYEFTFNDTLADHLNTVERVSISSSDLREGYYVVAVRAHILTESDTQAYGLAAAGGGLLLHDMSDDWTGLGVETQSGSGGLGSEPDPEENSSAVSGGTPALAGSSAGGGFGSEPSAVSSSTEPSATAGPTSATPASGGYNSSDTDSTHAVSGGSNDDRSSSSSSEGSSSSATDTASDDRSSSSSSSGGSSSSAADTAGDDGSSSSSSSGGSSSSATNTAGDEGSSSSSSSGGSSSGATDAAGNDTSSGGDDDQVDGSVETDTEATASDESGGQGFSEAHTAVLVTAAMAILLFGVGCCLAVRRMKVRFSAVHQDETGSFLFPLEPMPSSGRALIQVAPSSSAAAAAAGGVFSSVALSDGGNLEQRGGGEDGGYGESDRPEAEEVESTLYGDMPPLISSSGLRRGLGLASSSTLGREFDSGLRPPPYAVAVASPEEDGHMVVREEPGVERVVELADGDESEVSVFYAAVDPGAVETLVSWGISRDFARVALRQTGNNVTGALRIIAEGSMDEMLAMDIEEMAFEGREAAAEAVSVAAEAAEAEAEAAAAAEAEAVLAEEVAAEAMPVEEAAVDTAPRHWVEERL
ncbi:unnamed protein product [Pylaiella littoralis]